MNESVGNQNLYDAAEVAFRKALNDEQRADAAAAPRPRAADYLSWAGYGIPVPVPGRPLVSSEPPELQPPCGFKNLHNSCYIFSAYATLLNLPLFVELVVEHGCERSCITCYVGALAKAYHHPKRSNIEVKGAARALTERCETLFWGGRSTTPPKVSPLSLEHGGNPLIFLSLFLYHVRASLSQDAEALQKFDRLFSSELQLDHQCPQCKEVYSSGMRRYLIAPSEGHSAEASEIVEHLNRALVQPQFYYDCTMCHLEMAATSTPVNLPAYLLYLPEHDEDPMVDNRFAERVTVDSLDARVEYSLQSVLSAAAKHAMSLTKVSTTSGEGVYLTSDAQSDYVAADWAGLDQLMNFSRDQYGDEDEFGYPVVFAYLREISCFHNTLDGLSKRGNAANVSATSSDGPKLGRSKSLPSYHPNAILEEKFENHGWLEEQVSSVDIPSQSDRKIMGDASAGFSKTGRPAELERKVKILANRFDLPADDLAQLLEDCNGSLQRAVDSLASESRHDITLDDVPAPYQEHALHLYTEYPWVPISEIVSLLQQHKLEQQRVFEILKERSARNLSLGFMENIGTSAQFATRVSIRSEDVLIGIEGGRNSGAHVVNGTLTYRVGRQQFFGQFTSPLRPVQLASHDSAHCSSMDLAGDESVAHSVDSEHMQQDHFGAPRLSADSSRWNDYRSAFHEAVRSVEYIAALSKSRQDALQAMWSKDNSWEMSQRRTLLRAEKEHREARRKAEAEKQSQQQPDPWHPQARSKRTLDQAEESDGEADNEVDDDGTYSNPEADTPAQEEPFASVPLQTPAPPPPPTIAPRRILPARTRRPGTTKTSAASAP